MNLLNRKQYWKVSGIYCLESKIDSRVYIGSAVNLYDRISLHKRALMNNKHHTIKLQNFVNKYGIDNLEAYVLQENIPLNSLIKVEQFYLDLFKPYENGFNYRRIAESNFGVKRSPEYCKKLGDRMRGVPLREEVRKKISETNTGRILPQEWRNNISKGNKGKPKTKEHIAKIIATKKAKKELNL